MLDDTSPSAATPADAEADALLGPAAGPSSASRRASAPEDAPDVARERDLADERLAFSLFRTPTPEEIAAHEAAQTEEDKAALQELVDGITAAFAEEAAAAAAAGEPRPPALAPAPEPPPPPAPLTGAARRAALAAARSNASARLVVCVEALSPEAASLVAESLAVRLDDAAAVAAPVARRAGPSRQENVLRHGKSVLPAELARIRDVLGLPDLQTVADHALPQRVASVHLAGALAAPRVNLSIYTESPLRAARVIAALRCMHSGPRDAHIQVQARKRAHATARFGAADPAVMEAAVAVVAAAGSRVTPEKCFGADDHDLYLSVPAPAGATVWSEVPVVLVTDDPRSEHVKSVRGFLEKRGATVRVEAHRPRAGQVSGFELLEGTAATYGPAALDPLVAALSVVMEAVGLAPGQHTLSRRPGRVISSRPGGLPLDKPVCPELHAVSGADDSLERLSVRVWMPVRAATAGRLVPTALDVPAAWCVRLLGRSPVLAAFGDRLATHGFRVEHAPAPPEGGYSWFAMPEDRPTGEALKWFGRALLALPDVRHPATWVVPPERTIEVHIPEVTEPPELERRRRRFHARFRVHIHHGGAEPAIVRALEEDLRRRGFHVHAMDGSGTAEWEPYSLKIGGAPRFLTDLVTEAVGAAVPVLRGVRPDIVRAWSAEDKDIYLFLPLGTAARPAGPPAGAARAASSRAGDPFDRWVDAPCDPMRAPCPFIYPTTDGARIGRVVLRGFRLIGSPSADTASWVVDASAAAVLDVVAGGVARKEPVLLEGVTATSKTSAILYLAARLGVPVVRVNLSGHTDTSELIGRYLPAKGGGWTWCDGSVVSALRTGAWLVLDELNLAEPATLERLNPLLEAEPTLRLTEHDGERFGPGGTPIHPQFRLFATMNPSTYGGRAELSPALRDRFLASAHVALPSEAELLQMMRRLVRGAPVEFRSCGVHYHDPAVRPVFPWPARRMSPAEQDNVLARLARLFAGLFAISATPSDDPADPPPVWTRRGLLSLLRGLSSSLADGGIFEMVLEAELLRVVVARAVHPGRRRALAELLDANQLGPGAWSPRAAMD